MTSTSNLSPTRFVRDEIRELREYHLDLSPCRHKLDQNEVPYDLPRAVKRRITQRIAERTWAVYPDFHSDRLREILGERHGWPAEGILVGNGSNELLGVTLEALTRPGQEVLGHLPSFGLYKMFVLRAGGVPRFLAPRSDVALPMAELAREIDRDPTRPVILCTPNNPTGDAATPEAVEALLEKLDAPLMLDNAYDEFCEHDYLELARRHRHLILFRTFSKAWSLAGWRLGYMLADPELVTQLIKVKLPYNVGFASAMAAEEVLASGPAVDRRRRAILARRPQWVAMLEEIGFEVFPSQANFLLARWPRAEQTDTIRRGLEERSIRVRDVSGYPGLAGCIRFSVGSGAALRDTRHALLELTGEST